MKLKKILVLVLLIILNASLVCFATSENVSDVDIVKSTDVAEGEIIDNDYFTANENLQIDSKIIQGNAFLVAQTVEISNLNVTGSLYVAGQNVKLTNVNVVGSIFVAGQTVEVENTKAKNIYSASSDANFEKETVIEKNVYAIAENIIFNAVVYNDVGISGDSITIGNETTITGKLNVVSDEKPEIPDSATIGDFNFEIVDSQENSSKSFEITDFIMEIIKYIVVVIILALILIYIAPGFVEKIKEYELNDMVKSLGIGVLATIVIPILAFILAISVIGFRFFVAVSLLYIIGLMFATPVACIIIALMIAKKTEKTDKKYFLLYTLGVALVFGILKQIPTLSIVLEIGLGFVGFGTVIKSLIPGKKTE